MGDGPVRSGSNSFGATAAEVGVVYLAGGSAIPVGQNRTSRGASTGRSAASAMAPASSHASARPISTHVWLVQESDARDEATEGTGTNAALFPVVGTPTTVRKVGLNRAGGVTPEFLVQGDLGSDSAAVLSAGAALPHSVRTRGSSADGVGSGSDSSSPAFLAGLAYKAAGADAVERDGSEISFTSPGAAFLAHQAALGLAGRSVNADSRETGDAVTREDARLNTVSGRDDTGTHAGDQDPRHGNSDPQAVAMNEVVDDDEILEGELVDDFDPNLARWNPLGNADIVDVVA